MGSSIASRTARACRTYRDARHPACEVGWLVPVELNGPLEVHHILGRGRKPEYDHWSNLILVRQSAHQWGHRQHPAQFEVACIYAKWQRSLKILDGSWYYWNPSVLDVLCGGGGIAGRIEGILLPKVIGSDFERYAVELIDSLNADKETE